MSYYNEYPPYITVGEKREKAQKKLQQLRKKNPDIKPVTIEGRTLAHTWWGKAWNSNLEKYADYHNRIGRGRSYVRHGSVLDLQIIPGKVEALVMGTERNPYAVTVKIKPIKETTWKEIQKVCEGKLESLQELLAGKLPKSLSEIFTAKGQGLFPSPREIEFNCNCLDRASMCKHVASVLYGIGARLDKSPELFFVLRKVEMKDLITKAVHEKSRKMLKKAEKKTSRVIDDSNIKDIFNIDMEDEVSSASGISRVQVKSLKTKKKNTPKKKKIKIKKK